MEDFSVVIIARNEEKVLPRLLKSVEEVKDIVVLDTGSTDHTAVIAKSLEARVIEVGDKFIETPTPTDILQFKLRYGFAPTFTTESKLFNYSAARNYAMSLAENDFCFQPDADEVVEWDINAVRELLPTCDQLSYRFAFSHNEDGTPSLEFTHCKFFRQSVAHWVKKVHEVVTARDDVLERENLNRRIYTDKMYLHHWQQPSENRSNMLPKLEYAILEKENDDRNTYYLAREYYYNRQLETAIKMFERYLELPGWPPEQGQALIFMGDCYKWLGEKEKAIETYHRAIIKDCTRREAFYALGETHAEWGEIRKAVVFLTAALEIPYNPNYYLNNMNLYTWKIHDTLSILFDKLGEDEKAKYHWLEAVKAAPNDQRILDNAKWFHRKR